MTKNKDPFVEREQEKYDNPVPSREFILDTLEKITTPQSRDQIIKRLKVKGEDQLEGVRRRLIAMVRDGQLIQNKAGDYVIVDDDLLVRGRVIGHPDGFGFLTPEKGDEDVFLHAKQMRQLMHGDRAVVQVVDVDNRGRPEGRVVEILERANQTIVGRFFKESGICFVRPDNKRLNQDIFIAPDYTMNAEAGQIVLCEIAEHPSKHNQAIGHVVEVMGEHLGPGMEVDIAVRAHSLPHKFPQEVVDQASKFTTTVPEKAKEGRIDLRDLPLVTIDGEDAKDFDDAVYAKPTPTGMKLWVAIADVSAYVIPGEPLDDEARNRATSVYFPGTVIPMLPEVLSNGLCSLNPHVDRLCMVCEMLLDQEGKVKRSRFYPAVMNSHARLTYTQVAEWLDEPAKIPEELREGILALKDVYGLLRKRRDRRGAIDFETVETQIQFDKQRKIEAIVPRERNDAHKLIEECMILANVQSAKFLIKNKMPGIFRNHQGPNEERLEKLGQFLGQLGLLMVGGRKPETKHYAQLLKEVQGRPDAHLIQTVMLRSMSQAAYEADNDGHFGLALEMYSHFTSPIRRYPDLLVHRMIKHILDGGKASNFELGKPQMQSLAEHCSMAERRADEATRDAMDSLKCQFMQDKVGEKFTGIISSVTSFGMFVELKGVYIEGLVHITSLKNDYYHYDPVTHAMTGERSGVRFQLGDEIEVQVAQVNLDDKKIDLVLGDDFKAPTRKEGRVRKARSAAAETKTDNPWEKRGKKRKSNDDGKKPRRGKNTSAKKSGKKAGKKPAKKRTKR